MLRIDLAELERAGSIRVSAVVQADDPLWEGIDTSFAGLGRVELDLRMTASGQILAEGEFVAERDVICRRCVDPVRQTFRARLDALWAGDRQGEWDEEVEEEGEVHLLPEGARDLDLGELVREEVLLSLPRYPVCREECRGLCPHCGVNRNLESCACESEELDPRWAALRALKNPSTR